MARIEAEIVANPTHPVIRGLKGDQEALLRVASAAEARGWWRSQDKNKWYIEQLAAGLAPAMLKTGRIRSASVSHRRMALEGRR